MVTTTATPLPPHHYRRHHKHHTTGGNGCFPKLLLTLCVRVHCWGLLLQRSTRTGLWKLALEQVGNFAVCFFTTIFSLHKKCVLSEDSLPMWWTVTFIAKLGATPNPCQHPASSQVSRVSGKDYLGNRNANLGGKPPIHMVFTPCFSLKNVSDRHIRFVAAFQL